MAEQPSPHRQLTGSRVAAIVVGVLVFLVLVALLNGNWSLMIDA